MANRIAELREASCASRADVAAYADVDLYTVACWEDGVPIDSQNAAALAELFGVSLVWLLGLEEQDAKRRGRR